MRFADLNGDKKINRARCACSFLNYNFLNQSVIISVSNILAVSNQWDADGQLQLQVLYDESGHEVNRRLYHDGIEFFDGRVQAIHHPEGRYVFEYDSEGSLKRTYHEYMISDHLGNTRVRFADLNGDKEINIFDEGPGQEKEILGSFHYYPFGLKMEGIFHDQGNNECRYQYNGIEYLSHAGLNVSLATWRTHDPAIGRWWQVDPKAEAMFSYTPFNSMADNPISHIDPDGDLAWFVPIIIGATMEGVFGGIKAGNAGKSFFGGLWRGALVGAVRGAFAQVGGGTFIGNIAAGAFEGGFTGGLESVLWGSDVGHGILTGAKWGAAFGTLSSGIEAFGNAKAGHGFRTDVGVIKHYTNKGLYNDAIDFVQTKYGLSGVSMTFNPTLSDYGTTDPMTGSVEIGPAAFNSPGLLKATVVHEYGHSILDRTISASGAFSGWAYPVGKFPALDPILATDGPLGYAQEIYSSGRMKIGLKALTTDNPLWKEWSRSLGGGIKWQYVLPMRFQNKALIKWY